MSLDFSREGKLLGIEVLPAAILPDELLQLAEQGTALVAAPPGVTLSELKEGRRIYRCSMCRKNQDQVRHLISGPANVYLCNECVALANELLAGLEQR